LTHWPKNAPEIREQVPSVPTSEFSMQMNKTTPPLNLILDIPYVALKGKKGLMQMAEVQTQVMSQKMK
jgi:hypothetical protein